MKKKFLCISLILLFITIICSFTSRIYAATEPKLLEHDLLWNISSYYYYVSTESNKDATKYASQIAAAADNWVKTGYGWNNLLPGTRTYDQYNSACDFYAYSLSDGANAYTEYWKRANGHSGTPSRIDVDSGDWLFNRVYLNSKYIDSYTSNIKQGVVAHEFGHAFGLYDNNENTNSIMCQMSHDRAVYKVQKVDHDAFVKKHP